MLSHDFGEKETIRNIDLFILNFCRCSVSGSFCSGTRKRFYRIDTKYRSSIKLKNTVLFHCEHHKDKNHIQKLH